MNCAAARTKSAWQRDAIIDAAFDHLARSDTQAVLLAGDLTNDGEMVCHRELREKLYALAEKKPVYLITNTHDWCCDGNPRRFTGARVTHDVPTMPHTGIHDFYYDFGGRQAIAEYRTHLGNQLLCDPFGRENLAAGAV